MKTFLLLIFSNLLFSQITINWYRINFAPSLIYSPKNKLVDNSGYSDKARTKVIENLKNYKHKYLPISIKKVMKLAKKHKRKTICFAGLNKNRDRERFLIFSKPHLLSLPNQIIVRKDNQKIKDLLNKDGQLSLKNLLNLNFKLSIPKGRSYSSIIDGILKNNKNVIQPTSKDISHSYLKQVISKRVDFTIEYPVNLNYFATENKIKNISNLVSYPILEQSEKIKVYFGCSKKSGNAKKIISEIDKIIENSRKEMTSYYTDFLSQKQRLNY